MAEKHQVSTQWKGNLAFQTEVNGHKLTMDAPLAGGGQDLGPSPKKLLLSAIAACSGMDVVSILKKMRVDIEDLIIQVEGELSEEHPKFYTRMHLVYVFKGVELPMYKLEKAVKMSEETYCGVGALYRLAIPISSEIKIVNN